ncbi:MAG: 50S ribosomal protein L3 [Parcubacteria group bacterium]|nr:50S ribosomal protein L3 [Parcubacteria group bacterium]
MPLVVCEKIGMSALYQEGKRVPVTLLKVLPSVVTQIKTKEHDGYRAIQIGFGHRSKMTKPIAGALKGLPRVRGLVEVRGSREAVVKRGDSLSASSLLPVGTLVTVRGTSKGRGFAGVVKRHGFHGGPAAHGHKDNLRRPGSIGSHRPRRVFKDTRMAGRMGGDRITKKHVPILVNDDEHALIGIKGPVPGGLGSMVFIIKE